MNVEFDKSFIKSISKVKDTKVLAKVKATIIELEVSDDLNQIKGLKKLTGYSTYFRIRIGDYRMGLEAIDHSTLLLIILAHRKDIYKKFPPK